jgi:hypothetical protein
MQSTFTYRRDLIAMLSLVQSEGISERSSQYARLLEVLQRQLLSVETNFFEVSTCKAKWIGSLVRQILTYYKL